MYTQYAKFSISQAELCWSPQSLDCWRVPHCALEEVGVGQTQVFLIPVESAVSVGELVYTVRWCSLANLPRAWLQQRNQAIVSHVGLSVGEGSVIGFVGSWMVMALLASCWGCSGHPRPLHASKDVLGRTCVLLGIYL